jgi:hypothetical protein
MKLAEIATARRNSRIGGLRLARTMILMMRQPAEGDVDLGQAF